MILLSIASIMLGAGLLFIERVRRRTWLAGSATILSVESRDSDWDTVLVRFVAAESSITTTVLAPSELNLRQKRSQPVSIRFDPTSPSDARLESSPGKLKVVGLFLLVAGVIWLASICYRL